MYTYTCVKQKRDHPDRFSRPGNNAGDKTRCTGIASADEMHDKQHPMINPIARLKEEGQRQRQPQQQEQQQRQRQQQQQQQQQQQEKQKQEQKQKQKPKRQHLNH